MDRRLEDGVLTEESIAPCARNCCREPTTSGKQTGSQVLQPAVSEEQISGPNGEHVIDKVRSELAEREWNGSLPPVPTDLPKLHRDELIRRCKPKTLYPGNAETLTGTTNGSSAGPVSCFLIPRCVGPPLDIALEKTVEKITGCWLGMPRRFDRRFGFDLSGGDSQEHLN